MEARSPNTLTFQQAKDTLKVNNETIGFSSDSIGYGAAQYVQSGGIHEVTNYLILGESGLGMPTTSAGRYDLSGTGTLTVNNLVLGLYGTGQFSQTGGGAAITNLKLGEYETGIGEYTLEDGQLTVSGIDAIGGGYKGTGSFLQQGGTHAASSLYIGYGNESSGSYTLQGGELQSTNTYVGLNGTGSLTQSGGMHTATGVLEVRSAGEYSLNNGMLDVKTENMFGDFVQTGGLHLATEMYIGPHAGELATYNLQGGNLTVTTELIRHGTLNQNAGAEHQVGELVVGWNGVGEYKLFGGTLAVSDAQETIGYRGEGTFTQTGGTHTAVHGLVIGSGLAPSTGHGTYNFDGGVLDTDSIELGHTGGIGTFNQAANTTLDIQNLQLGTLGWGAGQGYYNLNGGTLSSQDEAIGVYERGQFIQSAGSNTVLNNLYLGMFTYTDPMDSSLQYAGSGDYILYDGLLDVKGSEFVGYQGKGGGVLHDNGTHNVAGELSLGYGSGSVGIYDLKSGTLNATSLNIGGYQGTGQFNQTGGTNAVTDNPMSLT